MTRYLAAAALLAAGTAAAAAPPKGGDLFQQNCSACHQPNGKGIPGAFPALAGAKFVVGPAAAPVTVVFNGRAGMPTFRDDLDDQQIAAVLSYVRSSWGNKAPPVDPRLVAQIRGGKMKVVKSLQAH